MRETKSLTRTSFIPNAYQFAWRVLDGDRDVPLAVKTAFHEIDEFLAAQKKNRSKYAANPTTPPFNEVDAFQYLLYEILEPFEVAHEEKKLAGGNSFDESLLILRYVEAVIRHSIRRQPYYLAVGIGGLLYGFDWETTQKINNVVMQRSDDYAKDQNEYNKRLRELKLYLIERFDLFLQPYTKTDGNDKKEFTPRERDEVLFNLVQEHFTLHVPWLSAAEHPMPDDLTAPDSPIPKLRSAAPTLLFRRISAELAMAVWRNRSHALIDPLCFQKLTNLFGLNPLKDKLNIPRFAQTMSHDDTNDSGSGTTKLAPEQPTPEFYEELFRERDERSRRRRKSKIKIFSIVVDGVEQAEKFDATEKGSFSLKVPGSAKAFELVARDHLGSLTLAKLWLVFYRDALATEGEAAFIVKREGGQRFEIVVRADKTADGEISAYEIVINYSQSGFARAVSLAAAGQRLGEFSNPFYNKRLKIVGAFAGLTLAVLVIAAGIYFFNQSSKQQTAQTNSTSEPPSNSHTHFEIGNRDETNQQQTPPVIAETSPEIEPPQSPSPSPQQPETASKPLFSLNDAGGEIVVRADGDYDGLPGYSAQLRGNSIRALSNGKIELPALSEISFVPVTQMGDGGGSQKPFRLAPNGAVVRSSRPSFAWEKYEDAEGYVVTVFDASYNEVAKSDLIQATSWKPEQPLPAGRIYSWELRAKVNGEDVKLPEKGLVRFKILDAASENQLRAAEAVAPKSHLALGVAYARAGLFADAEREFEALVRLNPKSKQAENLLETVRRRTRR